MELETKQLVLAIKTIADEKNLPEEEVHDIVEQAIVAAWKRDNDIVEADARGEININTGDLTIFVTKTVADEVVDEGLDISLASAKEIKKDAKVGDEVVEEFRPTKFGRVAAQTAKQVILQKLRESEREIILNEYSDKINSMINGVVSRIEPRFIRVDLGRAQGIIPASEQIYGEHHTIGSRIKVYLKDVEKTNRGPQLILSRGSEDFIRELFTAEVPEIASNAVTIEGIVREAGGRTKIAVSSSVPGVDPVGTFVGGHGTRVQAVSSEIGNIEKIDIIPFSDDTEQYIRNALAPAELISIKIDDKTKRATVEVAKSQLSIAIGKSGQNVRLASKLVGYEIDLEEVADNAVAPQESDSQPADSAQAEDKSENKDVKQTPVPASDKAPKPTSSAKINQKESNRIKSKEQVEEDLLATIAASSEPDEEKSN